MSKEFSIPYNTIKVLRHSKRRRATLFCNLALNKATTLHTAGPTCPVFHSMTKEVNLSIAEEKKATYHEE